MLSAEKLNAIVEQLAQFAREGKPDAIRLLSEAIPGAAIQSMEPTLDLLA